MSAIHLRQIKNRIENEYVPHIDVSDLAGRSQPSIDATALSRGLAAMAISERLGLTPPEAAESITDGYDDNGIDAIGLDADSKLVVVVQSKWMANGSGSPELGDLQKFAQGFTDLTNGQFTRFNASIRAREQELTAALDDTETRFELVVAWSGTDTLSTHGSRVFSDLLAQINDVSEIASLTTLAQADLHAFVRRGAVGQAPDLEVVLHDWGKIEEPYEAVYGQAKASDVADWWAAHSRVLFGENLRMFLPDSTVNEGIIQTLATQPEKFWYFNNGITVLCQKLTRAVRGAADRRSARFLFEKASVVNGAQTVGAIGLASQRAGVDLGPAMVAVRVISLDGVPASFGSEVTRATNTQNRILPRDFVALDPEQERLRTDLRLDDKVYAIKSGDPDPAPELGCTVLDATVALACAHSTISRSRPREKSEDSGRTSQTPRTRTSSPRLPLPHDSGGPFRQYVQ